MVQVSLSEQTVERVRDLARQRGADVTEILEQAIERYLALTRPPARRSATSTFDEQLHVIEQEQQVFAARHQEFRAIYAGETIAMRAGQVIDHDTDRVALSRRIRLRYGNQPIFMTPVLPEPVQTINTRSPRFTDDLF